MIRSRGLRTSAVALALGLLIFPSQAIASFGVPRTASTAPHLSLPQRGSPFQGAAPSGPNYDEQIGLTFTDTFTSLDYNVSAVAQVNPDGFGPAYLLNGLTDKGYWYQVGLSWDWDPGNYPGTGFSMNYEVFDTNGYSVYPASGGGGLLSYSGAVNQGDQVELSLTFSGGMVVMYSKDLNTGAAASTSYADEGASQFNGLLTPANPNGFFTGLMTEEYHASAYSGNVLAVNYTSSTPLGNGFLWADEFTVAPRSTIFYDSKFVSFLNPRQIQTFSGNGTTSYANAHSLVTGVLNERLITLSYSVSGGGTGFSQPVLTYTLNGEQLSASLTGGATTFYADANSHWSVSSSLPGGSSTQRWQTDQVTNGTLIGSVFESLVYYHQLYCLLDFRVNGGNGFSSPSVQTTQFGLASVIKAGASAWVDFDAPYFFDVSLPGSSTGERWVSLNVSGVVTQPATISVLYHHQFGLRLSYVVEGGGSPAPPTLNGTQFGDAFTPVVVNGSYYFLDPTTSWTLPSLLPGSTSRERWVATQAVTGNVSGSLSVTIVYRHQFMLSIHALPDVGGAFNVTGGWEGARTTVSITQTAARGWKFIGWNGSGAGSFTGTSNSSSVLVQSPIVENATFFPGLQISSGGNGEVSFSYRGATGVVMSGQSRTIYTPAGTKVTLNADASYPFYAFSGWSGSATGPESGTTVVLSAPASVVASFSLNFVVVGGLAGAAALVLGVLAFALMRRSRAAKLT